METLLHDIKQNIKGNFKNSYELLAFCRYHNLHHWFVQNQNLSEKDKELIEKDYYKRKLYNILLLNEWNKLKEISNGKSTLHIFKGLALSYQLFNDYTLRPTRDIDVWISFEDLFFTDYLIKEIGYRRIKPDFELNTIQKKHIHHHIHHFTYVNEKNIVIELHWQLFTPKNLFKHGEKIFKQLKPSNLDIYPNEWLLHYLIIHGSLHHWFKLIWLYDIHVLISNHIIDWEKFYRLAKVFRNSRMINVAFYLSNKLFGTKITENKTLSNKEEKIATYCLTSINNRDNFLLYKGIKRFKRTYYLSLLKSDIAYKISTWLAPFTTVEDWKVLPLPPYLYWFYYIFRPFIWFYVNYIKKSA